jgi:hypothetical protein
MGHAWCRDVARDAAVRAAEDGRDRPLPTLKECIAGMFPKSGSASSPVDQENKGDGMRTERVTLEVTHDGKHGPVSTWPFECGSHGESVRVVSDEEREAALPDVSDQDGDRVAIDWPGLAKVLQAERDAALRERDAHKEEYYKLRAARITQALTADRFASAVQEADTLKARVAALEAASGGGEQPRGWLTEDEREIIAGIADDDEYTEEGQNIAKGLLARSSPPEVDLPISLSPIDEELIRAALAAAGVAVKEVGK